MPDALIPAALQINMDDVGWWCGRDDRKIGGPSRTGMPRNHCVADYQAIADLGAELNMQINCSFVLGEWDMENRLGQEIPHFSHFGEVWNNSAYRDPEELEQAVEIVNNSPYIGVALHGLYHGYYMDGVDNHDTSDFFYRKNGELFMIPEDEVRLRLDHFYRLYEEHGFKKPITCFITPSGAYRGFELSEILKEYGIRYVATNFIVLNQYTDHPADAPFDSAFVENGIITVDEKCRSVAWDVVDADFQGLEPAFGVITTHWPNYLNMDPAKHHETRRRIVPYFQRCAETYGIMLPRNFAVAATQELYKRYAKTVHNGNTWIIDLSQVPKATGRLDSFYISATKEPVGIVGAAFGEKECHSGFNNYEIKPLADTVKVFF